jgi:D-aminoacyl-tRNA deacylase
MRAVVQRVSEAEVRIAGETVAQIGRGLLVLVGIEDGDTEEDVGWLSSKIALLRIFADAGGLMNLSVAEVGGELLAVSQFTLFASSAKGNRPSFSRASKPDFAVPMYERFVEALAASSNLPVLTGRFGADMQVGLTNDGPVTILLDSKRRE